jgi:hypothetical protein
MPVTSTYLLDDMPVELDRLLSVAEALAPEVRATCERAGLGEEQLAEPSERFTGIGLVHQGEPAEHQVETRERTDGLPIERVDVGNQQADIQSDLSVQENLGCRQGGAAGIDTDDFSGRTHDVPEYGERA